MIIAIHLFAAIERVDDLEAMKAFGRKNPSCTIGVIQIPPQDAASAPMREHMTVVHLLPWW